MHRCGQAIKCREKTTCDSEITSKRECRVVQIFQMAYSLLRPLWGEFIFGDASSIEVTRGGATVKKIKEDGKHPEEMVVKLSRTR
jgi:hypothetical protein